MRDAEGRKKEASKVKQTNKAKQHSTPKAVTFPKKNELPRVKPTTLYTMFIYMCVCYTALMRPNQVETVLSAVAYSLVPHVSCIMYIDVHITYIIYMHNVIFNMIIIHWRYKMVCMLSGRPCVGM